MAAPMKMKSGRKVKVVPKGTLAARKQQALVPLIKQVSKSEALRLLETKFVTSRDNNVTFNSAINGGFAEMYSLIPRCDEGAATNTYERVGESIKPLSITTNWHIALGTSVRTSNIRCVLYCLQAKNIKYYPDLSVYTTGPNMLRTGTSALTSEYGGRVVDENLPINTSEFTLLKKFTFNLMANVGTPNGDATTGNSPNTLPSFKNLSYTYKAKTLKYKPAGATSFPDGHAPFWVFGYSHTDGSAPDVTFRDVCVSYITKMTYKDA